MTAPFDLPAEPRILVVALRRLGDVLLTTPLIRSLRRAYPAARIDFLVFSDTAAILSGNPDIDRVIECPPRPSIADGMAVTRRIFRGYDLAITTQAGDRPSFFAIAGGRRRVGVTEDRAIGRIKSMLLHRHVPMRTDLHRVEETLRLAELIGIAPIGEVVAPRPEPVTVAPATAYAVLHAAPFFRYKQWHRQGWQAAAAHLAARGLALVATGGPSSEERSYLDSVWAGVDIQRLDGALSWPQLTALLAGAKVFLGPDTSVTHLAAATGCPTVALFGPTDPRRWAPWPVGGLRERFEVRATVQRRGNVFVVQNLLPGMPCGLEGCLRNVRSHSLCLDQMPADSVIRTLDAALAVGAAAGSEGGAAPQTPLFSH
ncbi:glycosyltransferase family 9 protein [Pseudorhodoplanes sp.]|uniref:glycosyltransferase family 9 protein n=1 Tax=Pseudorhodoplanes sp. TaxID=1934341 RepID=UPI003D11EFBE